MKKTFYTPIEVGDYKITDNFWKAKLDIVKDKMIPYQWEALNDRIADAAPSHCIHNFKIAAGMEEGAFAGCVFQDSDLAKWLEAVGYILLYKKDEELETIADSVIDIIEKAQQPDGYLDTYYIINGLDKRWTNLTDHHELYCAGHMIEAGIAYYNGTGKEKLLEVVKRLADCIDGTFGPEEGKIHAYPGHEIVEMALVRLYETTGQRRYLKLAQYFIDERGKEPLYFKEEIEKNGRSFYWERSLFQYQYYQAGKPVREQKTAEGHAVRAVYLYSGMASVAKETGDETLTAAVKELWENVTRRQMYITGAIGSSDYGEAFTFDYDLPNDEIYGETCASVGLIFWARRMLEMELKGEYADVIERALYNGCLSGMSQDGTRFFYVNPLEVNPEACRKDQRKSHVAVERQKWFGCACCPPNLARLIASLGNYACAFSENTMAVHLYIGGEIKTPFGNTRLIVDSNFPWEGKVKIKVIGGGGNFNLALRIPGWARGYTVTLNGEPTEGSCREGYLHLRRDWKDEDELTLEFPMRVEKNYANPNVKSDLGRVALTRGPLVYCLEEIDNGKGLTKIGIKEHAGYQLAADGMEAGEVDIITQGTIADDSGWGESLYRFDGPPNLNEIMLKFVPYYLWNNRGTGEMIVWIKDC
ncbi:glycoside hydrolase family 127 protein [Bariatricus massiliensis]|uniref:Glycoside hydrolase family 127 protein n=1 Tax=Bariatricus massiliensis TaxID=1745713 RepID=A0ABS8DFE7_9FIRM|nr:beta-L-arabinofuranosidase domain-containing protein [Bariatricus massiliensis]MCB7304030.1 glycoside hydrolase family 127 protein [Bariatricus massiliensis]MCB7374539.1 glycoside hydrolase family 127 protein [Bariatricus massiliensis]MCB7387140.1 glycoside hydrolase family 127 protein [Bariatricus massiliensis]MCB7411302.1 glycoside hydrolase family 127 protein [Bariatricus massiliensis]MCQ5252752.1 glycoside hydrolase family 127 protein [Bariatricus massiliensis]